MYIAVASPSIFGLVASITSSTVSSCSLFKRSGILISSGPIPSIGEIAPWRTWYRPLNSFIFSMAITSLGSCRTQITLLSLR
ncbi:Uncharacterised protein [Mycobacteroides abscessus subsp. abscessus]|nr:Uncharacterised protein [Mycobacteroides abscessus subsp. abscessus]